MASNDSLVNGSTTWAVDTSPIHLLAAVTSLLQDSIPTVPLNSNQTNSLTNISLMSSSGAVSDGQCLDGLFLPFWPHYDSTGLIVFHGIVYFLALIYIFVGVAIIADRFMGAIEEITSQEQDVIVRKPNGEKEIISVKIWNETVSNLTLMALGSSAPEILLSVIEICGNNFNAGDLGPGTIVGSAAFNMFVIIAICVWVVPSEAKKIKHLRVFCITMVFSVFAYIWLLYIIVWSTPGVIEVWEAFLTFLFFPITVLLAYIADKRLLIYKYLDKRYRMKRGRKAIYAGADAADGENLELTSVDANGVKLKVNDVELKGDLKLQQIEDHREEVIDILRKFKSTNPNASNEELVEMASLELHKLQPKSKAYYRIQAARKMMGSVGEKVKDHFLKSINEDFETSDDEKENNNIKIFFNPKEYTVLENIGAFQLTVSRSGALESTILVDYNTEDGTAKCGSDYEAVNGVISFGPGEQHQQISVKIINDDIFEDDEYFYVRLSEAHYMAPVSEDTTRPNIILSEPEAKVTILDDDHSGVFSFNNNMIQIPESVGHYHLRVTRFCGARGHVALPYKMSAGTAKPNVDFQMIDSKIEFGNNETHKDIVLNIINTDNYEKNVAFYVEIGEPYRIDYHPTKETGDEKGAPRLGELVKCTVRIRESRDFRATVDKLMRQKKAVSAISTSSWEGQFIEAVRVPSLGSEREADAEVEGDVRVVQKKSIMAYIFHYLTLFWKVLFACVPPPNLYNGWACFVVSIIVIGLLTALINDLASQFGCTIGLKDSVTAISLVALGTSVPDTFASKIAALNDKYADSSIGNVTGSNAVNVFLGIGIAWTIAAVYHAFKGTDGGFVVDPGNLSFSVTIFCISAFVCAAVLLMRRTAAVGGELGGPMIYKLPTTILFVALWLIYVVLSSLEAYPKVTILDDDHSGVFSFNNNMIQIPESVGHYHLRVTRFCGARGHVALPYKMSAGTAKPNVDFQMIDSKIEFGNNETHKDIVLNIINTDNYEKNVAFYVEIGEPYRIDYHPTKETGDEKGAPRLGELVKCTVRIRESRDFRATVDKLMRQKKAVSAISTSSWEGQFIEAVRVPSLGSEREADAEVEGDVRVVQKKSIMAYIFHYLTLFWKVLFACVPPPNLYNGWACFVVSIIVIGLLTALINDLASHFGCTIGLKDSVTAISLVALGTSVPDTFASKIAALNDKYADSSIGNVTGSNAVNVFLGIGIAWTIAAVYHAFKGTDGGFVVDPGNLSFSVTIFCISAFVCAAVLLMRRTAAVGGELGGPMIYKLPTTILFVALWLIYVVLSSLEAYRIIDGF
ncbi:unnamed protein product [Oppiella nova]|uniref:Calx-beta domain-containing protein n=1 Tax=Oppiella nova TaxID=334625 RepID=A0A7R9M3P8_9ACAR|nr:unnamed protein product [Oppiella nova]CAG2169985.1 unnamed protein product [Oppiella nova]